MFMRAVYTLAALVFGGLLAWAMYMAYATGDVDGAPEAGFSSPVADVYENRPEPVERTDDTVSLSATASTAAPEVAEVHTPAVEPAPVTPTDELSGVGVVDVPDPAPGEVPDAPDVAEEIVTDDGDDFTDEWGGGAPEPVMTGVSAQEDASYDACECAGMDMTDAQYTNADGEGIWEGPGGICWVDPAGNLFVDLP